MLLAVEGKDATVWERFAAGLGKRNGHPADRQITSPFLGETLIPSSAVSDSSDRANVVSPRQPKGRTAPKVAIKSGLSNTLSCGARSYGDLSGVRRFSSEIFSNIPPP